MRLETQPFFAVFCAALATAMLFCTLAWAWPVPAIHKLPVFVEDRAPELAERKREQLDRIADLVRAEAGGDRKLAAFVLAVGWHESRYSLRIMRSDCLPLECDPVRAKGKTVMHRARGTFQLHRLRLTDEEWEALKGPGSLPAQVRETVKRARSALGYCKGDVAGAFANYGGLECHQRTKTTADRVETYKRLGGW